MEKLFEAGSLYLNDYQILNEARKEVDRYLNSIVEEVYKIITDAIPEIYTEDFRVHLWENKSSKGHMQVQFICLKESDNFRKEQVDLYIIYKDIRNDNNIKPTTCIISLWTPAVASKLEKTLSKLAAERLGVDLYQSAIIEYELGNSVATAESIADEILNKCKSLITLLEELV